jgi:hypothetical protein
MASEAQVAGRARGAPDEAPGPLLRGLHLVGLCAFAVAQPLFDLVARHAQMLVAWRAAPAEIGLLVAALLLVPPAAAWTLELLAGLLRRGLGWTLHLVLVAALVGAAVLPAAARLLGLPGPVALGAAALAGAAGAWLYARKRAARGFATALALASAVFAAAFLAHPRIARLLVEPARAPSAPLGVGGETPVVLVVFDELPTSSLLDSRGEVDAVRYPTFARLAREAIWFRNASTVHAFTDHAVPAILTGLYPDPERLPIASDHPRSLLSLLGSDYALHVSEAFTYLHRPLGTEPARARPLELLRLLLRDLAVLYPHVLLPRELAAGLPPVAGTWKEFAATRFARPRGDFAEAHRGRVERMRRWIAGIAPPPRTLHFIHENLPHRPWQYLPSGRSYFPWTDFGLEVEGDTHWWQNQEWWAVQGYQRHLLQVGLVDALLGELLARLDAQGLYEGALLVVTADHGASFRAGEFERDPARMSHPEDVFAVPLFVKLPGQRQGRLSLRNAETVDVFPTVAEALGVRVPWALHGCSLLAADCPARPSKTVVTRERARLAYDPALGLRRDTLERKLSLFGEGGPSDRLFAPGPFGGLVGRRVAELRGERAPGRAILLREPFEKAAHSPETFSLARVTGALRPAPAPHAQTHVAVALKGRVAAVAPALPDGGGGAVFSAMLAEPTAPVQPADLEILLVEGPPAAPRLRPLRAELGG